MGSVRVGLAACDPAGVVASPVRTLARDGARRSDITQIADMVREREAVEVVVGLPLSLSGAEGQAATLARRYAGHLSSAVAPTPVRLVDERLTTVSAHQAMDASGRPGRRQREVVDQVAAVILLQAVLDRERLSGTPGGELVGGLSAPAQDRPPRKPRRRRPPSPPEVSPGAPSPPEPDAHHDHERPGGPAADDHGGSVETPWTA